MSSRPASSVLGSILGRLVSSIFESYLFLSFRFVRRLSSRAFCTFPVAGCGRRAVFCLLLLFALSLSKLKQATCPRRTDSLFLSFLALPFLFSNTTCTFFTHFLGLHGLIPPCVPFSRTPLGEQPAAFPSLPVPPLHAPRVEAHASAGGGCPRRRK